MRNSLVLLSGLLAAATALPSRHHYESACQPGEVKQVDCNTCTCMNGQFVCTRRGCDQPGPSFWADRNFSAADRFCDGECAEHCKSRWDEDRKCFLCLCDETKLEYGDAVVPSGVGCPPGLKEGPDISAGKVCKGQGCISGSTWRVNDGCSRCVCTDDGEPACTPCDREPTESTVTCEHGQPTCPADCRQVFSAEKNCYDCPCGVGEPGDTVLPISELCPPGMGVRRVGAFTKACAPVDQLPKRHRTILCGYPPNTCPADCTLEATRDDGCVDCKCGPEMAPGDVVMPIEEECEHPLIPGPRWDNKQVCLAPTKEKCLPGSKYSIDCDFCLCQEDGVPACTRRDCSHAGNECQYGSAYIDECENVCRCSEGVYGCTRKACRPGQTSFKPKSCDGTSDLPHLPGSRVSCHEGIVKVQRWGEPCLPNSTFMDEMNCNGCSCNEDFVAACTLMACPPSNECQYGSAYIDECENVCRCSEGVYGCTRKACRPGQTSFKPKSCDGTSDLPHLPGSRVSCHEGIVKVQRWGEPCLPNSTFMDEMNCNGCSCNEDFVAACTLMACPPSNECQYGSAYIDECENVCRCSEGVYGCTRKACRPGQTSFKPKSCDGTSDLPHLPGSRVSCHEGIVKVQRWDEPCLPHSSFMDQENCNGCFCNEDFAAACTLMACLTIAPPPDYRPGEVEVNQTL